MLKNILKVGKVLTNDKQKEVHGGRKNLAMGCPGEVCPIGTSYDYLMCSCEPD